MHRKLRTTVAAVGLLGLSVSSFGGSASAQTFTLPKPTGHSATDVVNRIEQRYGHLKSWTATYSGTRSVTSAHHATNPSGTIVVTAPDNIVVTPSGKGPIFGSCAEAGALMFLCQFSGIRSLQLGEESSGLTLTGDTMNRAALSELLVFHIDRTTYDVRRVSITHNNGNQSEITFSNAHVQR